MEIFFIIAAYLLGSLSSSIIVCRILNLPDPRTTGSQNAGATNVSRIASKKITLIVLLGDILKGLVAIYAVRYLEFNILWINLTAIAVVVGHIFPIFFNFKGGKGIATFFGVLIALSPLLSLIALLCWIITAKIFKYSSLASIVSVVIVNLISYYFYTNFLLGFTLLSLILIGKHYQNILRLLNNTENKIGNKKSIN